ncbi:hypothetical protein M9Y10_015312 [Tritrichomonas musculus]|uniref:Protein kinase domain-containing protein n=1 Tax=Tritrichomonas musculus TaxID=1915356 RepID=A0ABR2L1Z2_9EUKA
MLKHPWEIENIKINIDNEAGFLSKFIIYDDSNLFQTHLIKTATTVDFIGAVKDSQIDTEIMISNLKINGILIYLCILDNIIFIIKQINLHQLEEYFNERKNLLIFMTSECKEDFTNDISSKNQVSELKDQILSEQKYINITIKKEIIRCIIKKSQYRTIKMSQKLLPNKYNSKNNDYKLDDFILVQSQGFSLYYNSKDQILNVLKFYVDEKRFNHEIDFYHQIENTFPFIRKIFGIINQSRGLPIIILEYVQGERLDTFLLSEKEISFNTKIKIIEQILLSVYYVHSNGFYLRDLKPGNIIIDYKNDAILIDFDSSKKMYSSNEKEDNTCDIGNPTFTAPEQYNSNEYTYKVDSYSVGMIIHFIITRQNYKFSYSDLHDIYKQKENISKNEKFPKCPEEYEFILSIYEKCFEISPNLRPSITILIALIILDNNQLKSSNEAVLQHTINELEKYESIFKTADKYMYEESFERSYLQYFLGYIYYTGQYVSQNIVKAIFELEKASNQNNSNAQCYLGEIYYKGEYISPDINKSIHYLTLSANQNDSYAQYYLGEIYYKGEYISRDINKSIHYLILSSNQNNSVSQYLLGYIYYKGEYISRDINKSIHYLTLSANQNEQYAQFCLGEIYYKGKYISRDINKSTHYLTLSADQNNSNAQFYLGEIYYLGEYVSIDINKAIHYLTLSANQNNSGAQYYLGVIYYKGEYISRDINKSIHYFTLSADQNHSEAQYCLGEIYYLGEYVSRDIKKSIYYLILSANQNNSNAQCLLGFIYYSGEYISRDIKKSIHYLNLSANQNNSNAQSYLGVIYHKGEYISRDIKKSIHYLTLSSNQNNSNAQYYLGVIYYLGEYISHDINKAIHYLTLSANQYNSNAQFYLGEIYYLGEFISCDINKAIHYLTLSANQNNSGAQFYLGFIYYKGEYISRDINKSIHYFTLSANQNNPSAQCLLGYIYYRGEYISRDIKKSIHYLTISSNNNDSVAQCLLGKIYYDGQYIEKNINKSIHYFKESSCFNSSAAKNFLGVIYKNGDGVEKNIYFAKIYFKEAIKEKEEPYSMYNLARIYYFGIEHERKISKAIALLENASNKQLIIADLFLFYIFTICDDKYFRNQKKSFKYYVKFQYHFKQQMSFINFNDYDIFEKLYNYFRDYDLTYYHDYLYDLFCFLMSEKLYEWKMQNDNVHVNNKSLRKDINADFYEGFYD